MTPVGGGQRLQGRAFRSILRTARVADRHCFASMAARHCFARQPTTQSNQMGCIFMWGWREISCRQLPTTQPADLL